MESVFTARR